jgi:hypothetical protein
MIISATRLPLDNSNIIGLEPIVAVLAGVCTPILPALSGLAGVEAHARGSVSAFQPLSGPTFWPDSSKVNVRKGAGR